MTTNGSAPRSRTARATRLQAASGRRLQVRKRDRDDAPPASSSGENDHVAQAIARLGTTLAGKWTLDELLGVGGMAAVYAATHRNGNRVAIKLLHPVLGYSRALRERFLREGYAANRVDHDGVVRVLDDDELDDGTSFLVMEMLVGETLETRWQRFEQHLPLADVLGVADELLCVLGAAHEKGIHHRDIKPENLFLTRAGGLKVLDFGIARFKETMPGSATATRTGVALGTPAFMPPEQALGKSREIDGRTDLWAVAATMFTLLAGRLVHVTDSPSEMLVKAATERAPAFATVMPHIPEGVATILDRALSFEKEARFADAAEMRAAVQKVRTDLGYLPSAFPSSPAFDDADVSRPTLLSTTTTSAITLASDSTPAPSTSTVAPPPARRNRALPLTVLLAAVIAAVAITPVWRARKNHASSPVAAAPAATILALPPPTVETPLMTPAAPETTSAESVAITPPSDPTPAPIASAKAESPKSKPTRVVARKSAPSRPLSPFDHRH